MAKIDDLPFVNRESILDDMSDKLKNSSVEVDNSGIILYAKTGVGKSRFVDELFKINDFPHIPIKVTMRRVDQGSTPEGYYFDALYHAILEQAPKSGVRFPATMAIKVGFSYFIQVDLDKGNEYYFDNDLLKKFKAVKRLFERIPNRFVIDIENYQNIDATSKDLIIRLMEETKGNFYIFEYTISDKGDRALSKCENELCELLTLHKSQEITLFDDSSLVKLKDHLWGKNDDLARFEKTYRTNEGNILPLILQRNSARKIDAATVFSLVQELTEPSKLILSIIVLNQNPIMKRSIRARLQEGNARKFIDKGYLTNSFLHSLRRDGYIQKDKKGYMASHDSVVLSVERQKNTVEVTLAGKLLIDHFEKRLHSRIKKRKCSAIIHLTYLYSIFEDQRISDVIPNYRLFLQQKEQVGKLVDQAIKILKHLEDVTPSTYTQSIRQKLFEIAFEAGMNDTLKDLIPSKNYPTRKSYLISDIAARCAMGNYDVNLDQDISRAIEEFKDDKHFEAILSLHCFSYRLRTCTSSDARRYAKMTLDKKELSKFLEYYSLMKAYSELLGNREAIKTLRVCYKFFRKHKRYDLAARTLITLSSRLANNERYLRARITLFRANLFHFRNAVRPYYFMNNSAAMLILQEKFSKGVERRLETALQYPTSLYHQALILSNLLIYYSKTNNFNAAKKTIESLKRIDVNRYSYENFHHILLQNYLCFCINFSWIPDCLAAIDSIKKRIIELGKQPDIDADLENLITAKYTAGCLRSDNRYASYLHTDCRPGFIGYWQMEIGASDFDL